MTTHVLRMLLLASLAFLFGFEGGQGSMTESIEGKRAIVGLTFQDESEQLIGRVQYHARILRLSRTEGLVMERLDGGGSFALPPDPSLLKQPTMREYRLNSTGEIVREPDYIILLTVTVPAEDATEMRAGRKAMEPMRSPEHWTQDPP